MTNILVNPNKVSEKLKDLNLKYDLYFCQLIYEDVDGHAPFLDIEICKKCCYDEQQRRVIFEDGSFLRQNRYLQNDKFLMVKYEQDLYFQIHYCGLFYSIESITQNISIFSRQINKCFDRIVVKER